MNKMAIGTCLSIFASNVNGLDALFKRYGVAGLNG